MYALILLTVLSAPEPVHTERDAVGWAVDALIKYPEEDRQYVRFVYIPPYGDKDWIGAVDFAMNSSVSHSPIIIKGDQHAGGWLLGYNFKLLCPNIIQRTSSLQVWDSLAVRDSKFHVPGINTVSGARSDSVAFLSPHLAQAVAKGVNAKDERLDVIVTALTNSTGAIYPADFVIEQTLTSARGKYLEFRGITPTTKLSDHLKVRGFFPEASAATNGDKGALLISSDVTGKSRIILTTFGISSNRPMAMTFDFRDSTVHPDKQFFRNLITFQQNSDASELLIPLSNGLIEYILADGKGNIQRVAPPDVVSDFTKPDGHTKELESGMSCIICHANSDGYKTARNDMEFLLGADGDYFGDEPNSTLTKEEAVAIVASRYGTRIDEPDGILGRARRDYIRTTDVLTKPSLDANTSSASLIGLKIKEIYHGYRYRKIDAQRACMELGMKVSPEEALATLKALVPPSEHQEDIAILLLRNGASLKRDDMDAIYVEMARRVR